MDFGKSDEKSPSQVNCKHVPTKGQGQIKLDLILTTQPRERVRKLRVIHENPRKIVRNCAHKSAKLT